MQSYKFYKKGLEWYIDLPAYLESGGSIGDLQMIDGADTMLDLMSGNGKEITLLISRERFDQADTLELTEKCDPYIGGAYYHMKNYEGREVDQRMWLCQVTEYVFGDLPERIYVKRVGSKV